MTQDSLEKRNFLFFLNQTCMPKYEDSLIGTLSTPSSWEAVAERINTARREDDFVRAIKLVHLYVHVPFCAKICTYCGCSKVLLQRPSDIDTYVKAIREQIVLQSAPYQGMDAASISFGGGTPTTLNEEQMSAILDSFDKVLPTENRKIHIEIHPTSWSESKLALLSSRGLYRVSFGVQTMDDNVLKQVSRIQNKEKVLWCIRSALKAKVPYVNADLIAGLAGQTVKGFVEDLKFLINEGVNIIHAQPLTGTKIKDLCAPGESIPEFWKRRDAMMKEAIQVLQGAGFRHKIPDGWARPTKDKDYMEEAYVHLEAAVAAFGPYAKGQFPGAIFYKAGDNRSVADFSKVNACSENPGYVMSHYAAINIFDGLDEKAFLKRFGRSLSEHCGEGLQFLKGFGLVENSNGVWKFAGKWEFGRVRELYALSRIFFAEEILQQLRTRYTTQYDPKKDYCNGQAYVDSYAYNPLMGLYYSR